MRPKVGAEGKRAHGSVNAHLIGLVQAVVFPGLATWLFAQAAAKHGGI